MEDAVGRAEFEEYKNRIEQEDHRQNGRIKELEESTKQINALTVSIEKLAQSVESMVKEQEAQGKRLVSLENRDGEMWRKVVGYVVTAIIGIVVGFIFTQVVMDGSCIIRKHDDRCNRRRREHRNTGYCTYYGGSFRRCLHHRRGAYRRIVHRHRRRGGIKLWE